MSAVPSDGLSSLRAKPPKYCRKKGNGRADRAYVRIDGKMIMLGNYGTPESRQRYAELIGATTESKPPVVGSITVAVVMARYLRARKLSRLIFWCSLPAKLDFASFVDANQWPISIIVCRVTEHVFEDYAIENGNACHRLPSLPPNCVGFVEDVGDATLLRKRRKRNQEFFKS